MHGLLAYVLQWRTKLVWHLHVPASQGHFSTPELKVFGEKPEVNSHWSADLLEGNITATDDTLEVALHHRNQDKPFDFNGTYRVANPGGCLPNTAL